MSHILFAGMIVGALRDEVTWDCLIFIIRRDVSILLTLTSGEIECDLFDRGDDMGVDATDDLTVKFSNLFRILLMNPSRLK